VLNDIKNVATGDGKTKRTKEFSARKPSLSNAGLDILSTRGDSDLMSNRLSNRTKVSGTSSITDKSIRMEKKMLIEALE
jgi:hypothetical protein